MNKSIVSTLTTALLAGTAATGFAAANPFADVPADHWAYDAVTQLAKDGVIEGYGDGSYRGDQQITRYEMAQMVARAMAKTDVSAADKAAIDKLAAEFSDELTSLGVRVANLEKRVDNVKWSGELQYTYRSQRNYHGAQGRFNLNEVIFRIEPTAQINEHWVAKARVDYRTDMDTSRNSTDHSSEENSEGARYIAAADMTLDRAWVEGSYGNTLIRLGKLPYRTIADHGLVMEQQVSGGQVTFGRDIKATLTAGRAASGWYDTSSSYTYSYQGLEVYNDRQRRFTWGFGYHHFRADELKTLRYGHSDARIVAAGLGYRFSPTLALQGSLAWNTIGCQTSGRDHFRTSYRVQLDYKRADPARPHSFGLYAAWVRYGSRATLVQNVEDSMLPGGLVLLGGICGWEVGGSYTLDKNIVGSLAYSSYDMLDHSGEGSTKYRMLFARVDCFF